MSDQNNGFDELVNHLNEIQPEKVEKKEIKAGLDFDAIFDDSEYEKQIKAEEMRKAHARIREKERQEEQLRLQQEEEKRLAQEQRQQKLNNVLQSILSNMPDNLQATEDDILKAIEFKLEAVTRDTRRAAHFDRVRKAVAMYSGLTETSDKQVALLGIREAAANYLLERKKGSYEDRRELCVNLVKSIDGYIDVMRSEKHHIPLSQYWPEGCT